MTDAALHQTQTYLIERENANAALREKLRIVRSQYQRVELSRTRDAMLARLERGDVVVVPKEPTAEMIEAGDDLIPVARGTESRRFMANPENIYKAMLCAAQEKAVPAQAKVPGGEWTCSKCGFVGQEN
jgi:hypothetical protein